MLTSLRQK